KFQSIFREPSWNFKILAIPNVFANGKSYEHGFVKKHYSHKLCIMSRLESSFDRFFVHHLGTSKYWPFPTYLLMGSRTSTILRKNVRVINFVQSRAQSLVSIDFS
ncbi:hypothetical protein BHE74_00059123, partial [Ensete ventricosum]